MGQQQPSDMRRAIESAASHDERCERLVAVAQRVLAGASPGPDANQPDQVIVSREVIEALRVVLARF